MDRRNRTKRPRFWDLADDLGNTPRHDFIRLFGIGMVRLGGYLRTLGVWIVEKRGLLLLNQPMNHFAPSLALSMS